MSTIMFSETSLVDEVDTVLRCIKSFFQGTSCGRDGLRAQNLFDVLRGKGSAVESDLVGVITLMVNLLL